MNNKPVAWINRDEKEGWLNWDKNTAMPINIPLYTHPVKEQLSNGHLSDCAIHNEPALRNKPCDCGFEPKFNLSDLKHEDDCRYFDDGEFCTCGSQDSALVEWYRHKEVTHPVKELTDEEMYRLLADAIWAVGLNTDCLDEQNWADGITVAKAILRKAQDR